MIARFAPLLILIACVDSPSLDETTQAVKIFDPSPGDDGCPPWGCGGNSPVINAIDFYDLNEVGVPNDQGYEVTDFQKYVNGNWVSYRGDVVNDQLVIKMFFFNQWYTVFSGDQVVGARWTIEDEDGNDFYLTVVDTGRVAMMAKPNGVQHMTRTYRLKWSWVQPPIGGIAGLAFDICGTSTENDGVEQFHAILFDDDRIDADKIKVTGTDRTGTWFNIGCKGHALAKQHLLGHTNAAAAILGVSTTIAQRTANLKMLSADYCGLGHPFTVAGQTLGYRYATGWWNSIPSGAVLEARWDENGATCLNEPRIDFDLTPLPDATSNFPQGVEPLLAPAAGWCTAANPRPPPCSGSVWNMGGQHIVSANYH